MSCSVSGNAICVLVLATADIASAFDMRSCPLDQLTFVEPWSGDQFRVTRVGLDTYYACGEAEEIVKNPSDPDTCLGPFGHVLLEGELAVSNEGSDYQTPQGPYLAVYSLLKSTSPCCGWSVFSSDDNAEHGLNPTWLDPGQSPKLGDWPFAEITNSWGTDSGLDGVVALVCGNALG